MSNTTDTPKPNEHEHPVAGDGTQKDHTWVCNAKPRQIDKALRAGELNDLLGIITPKDD